jgi:hypothetical protein
MSEVVSKKIAENLAKIAELMDECKQLADDSGIVFTFDVTGDNQYHEKISYYPKNCDVDESEDETDEEYGHDGYFRWHASSMNC